MNQILVGKGERPVHLLARYGNRHGLVAGATGTGKTVSLSLRKAGGGVEGDRSGYPLYGLYLLCSTNYWEFGGRAVPGATADADGRCTEG